MDKNLIIKNYFTKDKLIKNLSSYILYYQVSLSNFILEQTNDITKVVKKIKELNLSLEPNLVILKIYDLIKTNCTEENFDKKLESYIKAKAMFHALHDLNINDNEFDWDKFQEDKKIEILNQTAFNRDMQRQYLLEYMNMYKYYNELFTDHDILEIQNILANIE